MHLLDLPQDVILKILCKVDVRELLRVERTCRSMRQYIGHGERFLWLVKLNDLDVNCDPGIPPDVSVEDLSLEELRAVIIRAVRQYATMTKPSAPTITYALKTKIAHSAIDPAVHGDSNRIRSARLVPGGRYMFITRTINWPFEFELDFFIIDMQNSHRRAWSLDPASLFRNASSRRICAYDFSLQKDSTIILVLVSIARDEGAAYPGLFHILRLSSDPVTATFKDSELHRFPSYCHCYYHTCRDGGIDRQISETFVALVDYKEGIITLLDLDDGKTGKLTFENSGNGVHLYQIWGNRLFSIQRKPQELKAFSLVQAMSLIESCPYRTSVDLSELIAVSLLVDEQADQSEQPWLRGPENELLYSVCDAPWRDSSEAVLTVISRLSNVIRAKFRISGSDSIDGEWELLCKRTSTILTTPGPIDRELSRSGQLLMYREAEFPPGEEWRPSWEAPYHIAVLAVGREGHLFFPHLSDNIAKLWTDAGEDSNDSDKVITTGSSRTGQTIGTADYKHSRIKHYDHYSRAIVVKRGVCTGKESLEIYYPE